MVTELIFKRLAEFLSKTDKDTAVHIADAPGCDEEIWPFSFHNGGYGFIFSVQTKDEKVVDIQARQIEWVRRNLGLGEFVEPPDYVGEAVEERVEFREDPNALAVLDARCVRCQEEYFEDVTPKIDLVIDGYYAQRIIEEYCPDCGRPLIQRRTLNPPHQYEPERYNENT